MKSPFLLLLALLLVSAWVDIPARAQTVAVTLQLDATVVPVGKSTTLHVLAQVVPAQRAKSERIFSWHIDLLNDSAATAQADYAALQRPASDNDSQTSSSGVTQGANRLGIYDTFIRDIPKSKTGIGINAPVELFSVPIKAMAAGRATFRVTAGSNTGLAADFIVAPKAPDDPPQLGGVYDDSSVGLDVTESDVCAPTITLTLAPLAGSQHNITLAFTPCAGRTHAVEFRDGLNIGSWQPLPGSPHNSGTATDNNVGLTRFYRVRMNP